MSNMNPADMEHVRTPIWLVDPEKLVPAFENPDTRTAAGALSDLAISMQENGPLPWCPVVIANEGVIGDGHRRTALAVKFKRAGDTRFDRIPVMFTSIPLARLWAMLNRGKRTVTAMEWLHVYLKFNLAVESLPKLMAGYISAVEGFAGREGLEYLYQHKVSAAIWRNISRTDLYCKRHGKREDLALIMRWLVKHNAQNDVARAITRRTVTPQHLWAIIQADKPLPRFTAASDAA
jgi:hypothetical protein